MISSSDPHGYGPSGPSVPYREQMGLGRVVLDLPQLTAGDVALETAAAELRERGVVGWRGLQLRTTETTGTAVIRRFTFTYWCPTATAYTHPAPYTDMWAGLQSGERLALLRLAASTRVTDLMGRSLRRVGGPGFLIDQPDGTYRMPLSFRAFLLAMATGHSPTPGWSPAPSVRSITRSVSTLAR